MKTYFKPTINYLNITLNNITAASSAKVPSINNSYNPKPQLAPKIGEYDIDYNNESMYAEDDVM